MYFQAPTNAAGGVLVAAAAHQAAHRQRRPQNQPAPLPKTFIPPLLSFNPRPSLRSFGAHRCLIVGCGFFRRGFLRRLAHARLSRGVVWGERGWCARGRRRRRRSPLLRAAARAWARAGAGAARLAHRARGRGRAAPGVGRGRRRPPRRRCRGVGLRPGARRGRRGGRPRQPARGRPGRSPRAAPGSLGRATVRASSANSPAAAASARPPSSRGRRERTSASSSISDETSPGGGPEGGGGLGRHRGDRRRRRWRRRRVARPAGTGRRAAGPSPSSVDRRAGRTRPAPPRSRPCSRTAPRRPWPAP